MNSTTSLRPAMPPSWFTYLANARTASTGPAKKPGRSWLSTSATTAMRISSAVIPMSEAAAPPPCAPVGGATAATVVRLAATAAAVAISRRARIRPPARAGPHPAACGIPPKYLHLSDTSRAIRRIRHAAGRAAVPRSRAGLAWPRHVGRARARSHDASLQLPGPPGRRHGRGEWSGRSVARRARRDRRRSRHRAGRAGAVGPARRVRGGRPGERGCGARRRERHQRARAHAVQQRGRRRHAAAPDRAARELPRAARAVGAAARPDGRRRRHRQHRVHRRQPLAQARRAHQRPPRPRRHRRVGPRRRGSRRTRRT